MNEEIFNEVLVYLYFAWNRGDYDDSLKKLFEQKSWDETVFTNVIDRAEDEGWISVVANQLMYKINAAGIFKVEEQRLVSEETITKNSKIRTDILKRLAELYQTEGLHAELQFTDMLEELGISQTDLFINVDFLRDAGYVDSICQGCIQITHEGIDAITAWKHKNTYSEHFQDIKQLNPQKRGLEFQRLFADYLNEVGWETSESVKSTNEEIDIIINKVREYFLLECKWLKDPVGAEVIREFYAKLANRSETKGIVVSMSGYTVGAIKQIKDYLASKLIIPFNQNDVNRLINFEEDFDALLDKKYKKLVSKREVLLE